MLVPGAVVCQAAQSASKVSKVSLHVLNVLSSHRLQSEKLKQFFFLLCKSLQPQVVDSLYEENSAPTCKSNAIVDHLKVNAD